MSETMRPQPVRQIPDMPPYLRGVSVVRGQPVPVVDVAALLGAETSPRAGRWVTVRTDRGAVALAFDEVVGVREIDASQLEALPPLLAERGALAGLAAEGGELMILLAALRVIPLEVMARLEADLTRSPERP